MKKRENTLLEHTLLGLLYGKPASGYDLRKIFALTPMKTLSDSPGAIYPALQRLQKQGMVSGRVENRSGRRRQVLGLTTKGTEELKRWIASPITRDYVMGELQDLMLRFAFSEPVLGREATLRFLEALIRELESYISTLHVWLEANRAQMPLSGKLALESGIRGYEAQLQWARDAVTRFRQEGAERS